MNRAETADLLATAATFDGRNVGEEEVLVWQQVLSAVPATLGKQAVVDHYASNRVRIMPSEILTRVRYMQPEAEEQHDSVKCPFRDCSCTHTAPCDRGWIENDNGSVKPCSNCRPQQARIVADSRGREPGGGRLRELRDRGKFGRSAPVPVP